MNQNLVSAIGRLGVDPEVTYTTSGDAVCNFSLAVSEYFKKEDGTFDQETTWINFTAWKRLAERMGEVGQKGTEVSIMGKIREKKWQDKEGQTRYRTYVLVNKVDFGEGRIIKPKGDSNAPQNQDMVAPNSSTPDSHAPPSPTAGKPAVDGGQAASQAPVNTTADATETEDDSDLPF